MGPARGAWTPNPVGRWVWKASVSGEVTGGRPEELGVK